MQITGQFSGEYLIAYRGDSEIAGMYENMIDTMGIAAAQDIMCALRNTRCDCADAYLTVFANYFNKAFETQRYEKMAALKVEGNFERCREKVTEIAEYWAHKLVDKIPDDYVCSFLTVRDIRVVEFLQKQLPYVIEM